MCVISIYFPFKCVDCLRYILIRTREIDWYVCTLPICFRFYQKYGWQTNYETKIGNFYVRLALKFVFVCEQLSAMTDIILGPNIQTGQDIRLIFLIHI